MTLRDDIAAAIGQATGAPFSIRTRRPVRGGCISAAFEVSDGTRRFFVKTHGPGGGAMFAAEAAGLAALAATRTVCVPQPVCHGANAEGSWLALEFVALARDSNRAGRALGTALAALHRVTAARYGFAEDNFIGATPQHNRENASWVDFWRRERLGFQLDLAANNGHRGRLQHRGERLLADLDRLLGTHRPPPSLLHGDLWGGNWGCDERSTPVVFDPAVYYGDREADLAMTELFGGFGADFHAAYREAWPLDAGYAVRRTLYNLYHVLNHLNLFGGGYRSQAEAMIDALLAEM